MVKVKKKKKYCDSRFADYFLFTSLISNAHRIGSATGSALALFKKPNCRHTLQKKNQKHTHTYNATTLQTKQNIRSIKNLIR